MCKTNEDCADNEECALNNRNIPECRKVCDQYPCGRQTICKGVAHRPVCSCRDGFFGDPRKGCVKKDCESDNDCSDEKYCEQHVCKIACLTGKPCGENSVCSSEKHRRLCSCKPGYTGNPNTGCIKLDYCSTKPCGDGSVCKNMRNEAQCSCPQGTVGDPYKEGCQKSQECRANRDCPSIARCTIVNGKRKCTGKTSLSFFKFTQFVIFIDLLFDFFFSFIQIVAKILNVVPILTVLLHDILDNANVDKDFTAMLQAILDVNLVKYHALGK